MQRRQAFKYALRPNAEQQRDLCRFAGCCRFVFNQALALQKAHYEAGRKYIGYVAMAKLLTQWRRATETPWLKQAPVHPLQHALKDLERSYQNFFAGRAGFPRFKRKAHRQSFRYPDAQQFEIDESHSRIFLPELGWIRYRNSRDILGKAGTSPSAARPAGGTLASRPSGKSSHRCPGPLRPSASIWGSPVSPP